MLSKTTMSVAAAGIAFIGYCIYFDRKRRNAPDYKEKLRERRKQEKLNKQSKGDGTKFPDFTNQEAMQKFFLQEIQKGEELLATGEMEEGIEHLSNAVAVCGQPQQLLQVLQQTLPPQVFTLLVQKLPSVGAKLQAAGAGGGATPMASGDEPSSAVIDEVVD